MSEPIPVPGQEQCAALHAAVLEAATALRRTGYRPHRIEADWPACTVIGRIEATVVGHTHARLYGFQVEQHDDPGVRVVGIRGGDTYKTIPVASWPDLEAKA